MLYVLVTILAVALIVVGARMPARNAHDESPPPLTPDQQERLARLRERMERFVEYLVHLDDPMTRRLLERVRTKNVQIQGSTRRDFAAFTENKGDRIAVCLSDTRRASTYDNDLFYVLLHELAHLSTVTYGHNQEFWDHFAVLQRHAQDAGLLAPVSKNAQICGHDLMDDDGGNNGGGGDDGDEP